MKRLKWRGVGEVVYEVGGERTGGKRGVPEEKEVVGEMGK